MKKAKKLAGKTGLEQFIVFLSIIFSKK